MKKILLFALSLCCLSTFAQDGYFFQGLAGGGIGNTKFGSPGPKIKTDNLPAYEIRLGGGHVHNRLAFGVAVGFKRSSFDAGSTEFSNGTIISLGVLKYYFNHVSVPATIGLTRPEIVIQIIKE